jgi:predicted nucleic acid-binding protein
MSEILLRYVLDDIRDLNELALKVTSTAELIEDALVLAAEKNLTAYDACYAVLAQKLDVPLVTADAPLAKANDWAIWIGDVEI